MSRTCSIELLGRNCHYNSPLKVSQDIAVASADEPTLVHHQSLESLVRYARQTWTISASGTWLTKNICSMPHTKFFNSLKDHTVVKVEGFGI